MHTVRSRTIFDTRLSLRDVHNRTTPLQYVQLSYHAFASRSPKECCTTDPLRVSIFYIVLNDVISVLHSHARTRSVLEQYLTHGSHTRMCTIGQHLFNTSNHLTTRLLRVVHPSRSRRRRSLCCIRCACEQRAVRSFSDVLDLLLFGRLLA